MYIVKNNKISSKFFNFFLNLKNLYILQVKTTFNSGLMLSIIFILPIILLFGIGILIPQHSVFVPTWQTSILILTGLLFGYFYFSFETSTLKFNSSLSNVNNKIRVLSIYLVILTFIMISTTILLFVFWLITSIINIISPGFWFFAKGHEERILINFKYINYGYYFYFILMSYLLNFITFGVFRFFFRTNKTFSMFIMSFFLYTLFFGGVTVPRFIANDGKSIGSSNYFDNQIKNPNSFFNDIEWNEWSFYASFLTPTYFINQQFASLFRFGASSADGIYGYDGLNVTLDQIKLLHNFNVVDEIVWANQDTPGVWVNVDKFNLYHSSLGYGNEEYWINNFDYRIKSINPKISLFQTTNDLLWNMSIFMSIPYIFILLPITFLKREKRKLF